MSVLPRDVNEGGSSGDTGGSLRVDWRDKERVRLGTEKRPFNETMRPADRGLPSLFQERIVGVGLVVLLGDGLGIFGPLFAYERTVDARSCARNERIMSSPLDLGVLLVSFGMPMLPLSELNKHET